MLNNASFHFSKDRMWIWTSIKMLLLEIKHFCVIMYLSEINTEINNCRSNFSLEINKNLALYITVKVALQYHVFSKYITKI